MTPTADEIELARIAPALQSGLRLAMNELAIDLEDLSDLFYEVATGGCMVDVYIKANDGRTAIGTAFAPKPRH